jgi:hypothetical protein
MNDAQAVLAQFAASSECILGRWSAIVADLAIQ